MNAIVALKKAKDYAEALSSGIQSSSYDPTTSTMRVELTNGSSYEIEFEDGISVQDRVVLDNIKYDEDTSALLVGDKEVLTKDDIEDSDIDFGGMFD
jgi:hypothetical protein